MIEKKKLLFSLAASALVAACGGSDTSSTAAGSAASSVADASAAGVTGSNQVARPAETTAATPAANDIASTPSATTPAPVDQPLAGYLTVEANQVVFIRRDRVIYLPVNMTVFESDTGVTSIASGSSAAHVDIDIVGANCNPAIDGRCGIQPSAVAPAAPLAAFGIRVLTLVEPSVPEQAVGNQTVVGRIAVDLTERPNSDGVPANEMPEIMRFVIDQVEISTGPSGQIVSARVQDGAQIHVYGRNAAGIEVRQDIPAPAGTVRLLPLSQIPDNHGDTGSVVLLLDLEAGFSQAGQTLAALENIAGQFSMHVTLSSVQRMLRPAARATSEFPALQQKDLVGQPVTVNDQPPVSGAGVNGNVWIRMYPLK